MKDNNNNSMINSEIQSLNVKNNENIFNFNNKLNNNKKKLFEKISNLKTKRKKASNFSYSKYIDSNIYKNLFSFDKIGNTIFFIITRIFYFLSELKIIFISYFISYYHQ